MADNGKPAFFAKASFPPCAGPESTLNAAPPDPRGEVPEWSNGAVSKTVVGASPPRVRIPVSPPFPQKQTASKAADPGSSWLFPDQYRPPILARRHRPLGPLCGTGHCVQTRKPGTWPGFPMQCAVADQARRRRPPARPPRPRDSSPAAAGALLNLIQSPPCGSLLVSRLAARMASISLPAFGRVEPRPNI